MNSEEGVSLAKMAVTVLLVVLVIGAVVAIVYKAYSWFNSGADKLGDQVNSIDSSSYSQYDDAQVSGTDVLTALKSYRDSNIAICIAVSNSSGSAYDAANNTTIGGGGVFNYCGLLAGAQPDTALSNLVAYDSASGTFKAASGIEWDQTTGLAKRNTNFSPTTNKNNGGTQFVKQGGQFYANLIWDGTTGEVCGILFRQMGN